MTMTRADYFAGLRNSAAVVVSASPFALLFGALAVKNGLSVGEAVLMSATLYAGASQMVGIELFGKQVAPWLIVFSIFAVNFRHVLYSASIGRHFGGMRFWQKAVSFFFLVDPQYAAAESRVERGLPITFAWFIGMGTGIFVCWVFGTWIGALFGGMITNPRALGVDFLLPIYFLGILLGFRTRSNFLPVVIAAALGSIVAFHLVGSPWHVSLGALFGIVVAVLLPPGDPAPVDAVVEPGR